MGSKGCVKHGVLPDVSFTEKLAALRNEVPNRSLKRKFYWKKSEKTSRQHLLKEKGIEKSISG
jgi:hypothetical protein